MIPSSLLAKIISHVEKNPLEESCGLVLKKTQRELTRVIPCTNIQNRLHAEDPKNYPRNSKTAYFIEPKELLKLEKEMRMTGESIGVIYHSHIESDAYFSEEDERQALYQGNPIFLNVTYLVLSVRNSKVVDVSYYHWSDQRKKYEMIL